MRFGVGRDKEEALRARMRSLGIREEDIDEKFVLASKKGGQKVNKTSACVYIKYRPLALEVKCQEERSQALNRFLARRILVDKVASLLLGRQSDERQRIEKIRRQKRKRSRRAKEKMLRDKKLHAEKKRLRKIDFSF